MTQFDKDQARDIFKTNALADIPEELTALGLARKYQKEEAWLAALAERNKGNGYRQSGKSIEELFYDVCTRRADLVLYEGIPQVHDYDEKHLLVQGISSVDADGNVVGSYPQLLVMKDVFRDEAGKIKLFTPYQAIRYCEEQGYVLPPSNLTIPLVAVFFHHRDDPEVNKVLMQYNDKGNGNGWHAQNSVIGYNAPKMIHYPVDTDFPRHGGRNNINASRARTELAFKKKAGVFPFTDKKLENMALEEGLNHPLVSAFVKQFTGLADLSILVEVGKYFQKPAKVWFPTRPTKVEDCTETKGVWLGCDDSYFNLYGDSNLYYYDAARGVREL